MTRATERDEQARQELEARLDLADLAAQLRQDVPIEDRRYRLKTYRRCFVGAEACDWLVESGAAVDREQAVVIGNILLNAGVFHHVVREHEFEDEYLFYRFTTDEDHGRVGRQAGAPISWADIASPAWRSTESSERESLQPARPADDELGEIAAPGEVGVTPLDEHNAALLDSVHPRAWINPEPEGRYNMVVVGAGTGGLVTAAAAAGLGARVALIEEHLMGGDCLNFGCVPSKALLRCARAAHQARHGAPFGVHVDGQVRVEFGEVMERMRRLRAQIAPHDSAQRFAEELGVDVYIGRARFTGSNTVEVDGQVLEFARACIATGASPTLPPIEGLAEAPYLTNHTLYDLTERPERVAILGAGVIGAEMAQALQRLGAQVTLLERGERILRREQAEAAQVVADALARDGVELRMEADIERVSWEEAAPDQTFPTIRLHLADGEDVVAEALLVATGRKPNVEGMGLEEAGVAFDPRRGVEVDDRLQSTNPDIYAVGDVATRYQFTHAADFTARLVVRNALFFGRDRCSELIIPWCTYTDPELAHVGLYPSDLEERGLAYQTFTRPFEEVDRAILEGATEGFVQIHVREGSDEILGATIVGQGAGDMISEVTLAMQSQTGLGDLASVIHPYPTMAEAVRQSGDMYNRTRLTLTVKKIFRQLLALRR